MSSLRELLRRLPRSTAAICPIQSFLYVAAPMNVMVAWRLIRPPHFRPRARHRGAGDQQGWYLRRNMRAPIGNRRPTIRVDVFAWYHVGLPSVYLRSRVYVRAHSMIVSSAGLGTRSTLLREGRAHKESTIY